jgi:uncharacterized integral membrane protein (TIGR00698 family)
VLLTATGVGAAFLAHQAFRPIGVLTWAVLLGVALANTTGVPANANKTMRLLTKRLLRTGIVLLGLSLSVVTIARLGGILISAVVLCLVATFLLTVWLGQRLRLARSRVLIIAAGFSICGASAIAAMEDTSRADDEDVAAAVGLVTMFGSVSMIALPLLQPVFGLSDRGLGIWAGSSVHEVGQVVAAAGPAGTAAVGIAVVVKLTRVLCLAPMVAGVSAWEQRKLASEGRARVHRPALIPTFVLGFLFCVAIRSTGLIPESVLSVVAVAQGVCLASALFGMGTSVSVRALFQGSRDSLILAASSTAFITGLGLVIALSVT